jgi:hypothetical protein
LKHYADPNFCKRQSDSDNSSCGVTSDSFFAIANAFTPEWTQLTGNFEAIPGDFDIRYSERNDYTAFKGGIWNNNDKWTPVTTSVAISGDDRLLTIMIDCINKLH